jgi:hypothetical protein
VGTNPLPRNGRNTSGCGRLLALSTVLDARPMATVSQVRAKASSPRTPAAAIHSTTVASGRNPTATATATTTATARKVCSIAPTTWPVSTDTRAIAIVRNRATMPSVMSRATDIEVPSDTAATAISRMPGVT